MEKTMKEQSCDGYGNFMNTMKEMQPITYFSCDLSGASNLLDWQLKLDSGIEVIIEDEIICHSGHFYEGTKSCYFLIAQQSNTFSRGQWVSIVLTTTAFSAKLQGC